MRNFNLFFWQKIFWIFKKTSSDVIWSIPTYKYKHCLQISGMCILRLWEMFPKKFVYFFLKIEKIPANWTWIIALISVQLARYPFEKYEKNILDLFMRKWYFERIRSLVFQTRKRLSIWETFIWLYLKHMSHKYIIWTNHLL